VNNARAADGCVFRVVRVFRGPPIPDLGLCVSYLHGFEGVGHLSTGFAPTVYDGRFGDVFFTQLLT